MRAVSTPSLQERVSVVMPIKGGEGFTRRWLSHHARIGLSCPVLIDDGDPSSTVRAFIDEIGAISSLDLRYRSSPEEASRDYAQLFRRIRDLLRSVETPYVMFAHNDDFILPSGLEFAVDFLDTHADHVACGAAFLGVHGVDSRYSLAGPVVTAADWVGLRIIYPPLVLEQERARDRARILVEGYAPTWFAVHRTGNFLDCFQAVLDLGLGDLLTIEIFQALFDVALGKVRQDYGAALYLRQLNSSTVFASLPDVFERMYRGTMIEDYRVVCSFLSARVSSADGELAEDVERELSAALMQREKLEALRRAGGTWKNFLSAWAYVLRAKIRLVHRWCQVRERRRVFGLLARRSGSGGVELRRMEAEVDEILSSLCASFES